MRSSPRSRTRRSPIGLVCVSALLSGCVFSSAEKVHDIDPLSLPARLMPTSTASAGPSAGPTVPAARVYFVAGEILVDAVRRPTMEPGRPALQHLLDELTAGPSSSDRRRGLSTALPPATRITVTDLEAGIATLDLTVDQPPPNQTIAIAQIVLTATSMPKVTALRITINGESINPPLVNGAQTDRPLTRDDYVALLTQRR